MSYIHINEIKCPHCGVEANIREYGRTLQVRTVTGAFGDGYSIEYPYDIDSYIQDDYDYELERYVCSQCDATLAETDQELLRFLMENGYLPKTSDTKEKINKIEEIN